MELELGVWSDASQTEREMPYDFTYMQNLKKKDYTDELIYKTETDSQT